MLKSLFVKKQPDPKVELMNEGIELAMAFGKNWKVSTQDRFAKKYPSLSTEELNYYNQQFINALKYAKKGYESTKVVGDLTYEERALSSLIRLGQDE